MVSETLCVSEPILKMVAYSNSLTLLVPKVTSVVVKPSIFACNCKGSNAAALATIAIEPDGLGNVPVINMLLGTGFVVPRVAIEPEMPCMVETKAIPTASISATSRSVTSCSPVRITRISKLVGCTT